MIQITDHTITKEQVLEAIKRDDFKLLNAVPVSSLQLMIGGKRFEGISEEMQYFITLTMTYK